MSLIKKTDVKNHLSARNRTEIHLEPSIQADATGFAHEDPAAADTSENDSIGNPLSPSPSSEREPGGTVPPKSVQN